MSSSAAGGTLAGGTLARCACGWTVQRWNEDAAVAAFHLHMVVRRAEPVVEQRPIQLTRGYFGNLPAKGTCAECPMRRDSKRGALGGWTPEMYIEALGGLPDIACHLSKGFDVRNPEEQRSCTGVANFRCNTGLVARLPHGNSRIAALHAGPNHDDVFSTLLEFYRHHKVKEV